MKSKINPFKEKIKIEMVKKGYTQSKMADLLGISNQAFSAWLNGSNPKIKTLEKIAKILGLSVDDFFEGTGNIAGKRIINTISAPSQLELIAKDIELLKKEIEIIKLKLNK